MDFPAPELMTLNMIGTAFDRTQAGLARITLTRPERGNTLSRGTVDEIIQCLEEVAQDRAIHTIVFRAMGRHFCTGFDLGDLATEDDASLLYRFVRLGQLLSMIWRSPVKTLALAQGRIWGVGADLFAACDVRTKEPD